MSAPIEKDYVLGTHDEEIARLGLQHRVWRPRASDAWRRAGFTIGQTIMDVGCGPGYATIDLAEIVGPSGRIIAVDRSKRFLSALDSVRNERGIRAIEIFEQDLDEADLPATNADGAWSRWVFAFVKNPRKLLERVVKAVRPGGIIVLHEYFDYSTWRISPRSEAMEEFVQIVMRNWRESGGEPDIGLELPRWLAELQCEVRSLRPIIDVVPPSNFIWQWPKSFVEVGIKRFRELDMMTAEQGAGVSKAIAEAEASPNSLMITPSVLEIIAVRR